MTVGPSSVGYRLTTEALCFGGQQCTTTDVAIAAGVAPRTICTTEEALASLQPAMVYATMREIRRKVEAIIDSMKVSWQCSVCFHRNILTPIFFLFCFVFLHNILRHIGTIAMSIYTFRSVILSEVFPTCCTQCTSSFSVWSFQGLTVTTMCLHASRQHTITKLQN